MKESFNKSKFITGVPEAIKSPKGMGKFNEKI